MSLEIFIKYSSLFSANSYGIKIRLATYFGVQSMSVGGAEVSEIVLQIVLLLWIIRFSLLEN